MGYVEVTEGEARQFAGRRPRRQASEQTFREGVFGCFVHQGHVESKPDYRKAPDWLADVGAGVRTPCGHESEDRAGEDDGTYTALSY